MLARAEAGDQIAIAEICDYEAVANAIEVAQVLRHDEMRSLPCRLRSQNDVAVERLVRSGWLAAASQLRPQSSGIPHRTGIEWDIYAFAYNPVEIVDLPGGALPD